MIYAGSIFQKFPLFIIVYKRCFAIYGTKNKDMTACRRVMSLFVFCPLSQKPFFDRPRMGERRAVCSSLPAQPSKPIIRPPDSA